MDDAEQPSDETNDTGSRVPDADEADRGQRLLPTALRYDERGLIPAIVQQHDTGEVLMMAWMNADSLAETLRLGETVFWSRSRGRRWHKGETSGNTQRVVAVTADCDADVLLVAVDQQGDGVACHTGARTCFSRPLQDQHGERGP